MSAHFSLMVGASPRQVFTYLADPRHRPEWQASLRGIELVDDGPPAAGTRWVDRTVIGVRPRLEIVTMEAPGERHEPGRWAEVGRWHGIRASLRLMFVPVGVPPGRTQVRVSVDIDSTRRLLPVRLVLQAVAPAAIRSDLRRAACILESRTR